MDFHKDFMPIYDVFSGLVLFASSFFIPLIFIIYFFNIPIYYIYCFLLIAIIAAAIKNKIKHNKIRKIIDFFWDSIKVSGSLFVLFLFLNIYLKISAPVYNFYLKFWKLWQISINEFALSVIFTIWAVLLYFFISSWLVNGIMALTRKTPSLGRTIGKILLFIFFILIPLVFYIYSKTAGKNLFNSFILNISKKATWIFGFSLVYLHLSYLLKKIIRLRKANWAGYN